MQLQSPKPVICDKSASFQEILRVQNLPVLEFTNPNTNVRLGNFSYTIPAFVLPNKAGDIHVSNS